MENVVLGLESTLPKQMIFENKESFPIKKIKIRDESSKNILIKISSLSKEDFNYNNNVEKSGAFSVDLKENGATQQGMMTEPISVSEKNSSVDPKVSDSDSNSVKANDTSTNINVMDNIVVNDGSEFYFKQFVGVHRSIRLTSLMFENVHNNVIKYSFSDGEQEQVTKEVDAVTQDLAINSDNIKSSEKSSNQDEAIFSKIENIVEKPKLRKVGHSSIRARVDKYSAPVNANNLPEVGHINDVVFSNDPVSFNENDEKRDMPIVVAERDSLVNTDTAMFNFEVSDDNKEVTPAIDDSVVHSFVNETEEDNLSFEEENILELKAQLEQLKHDREKISKQKEQAKEEADLKAKERDMAAEKRKIAADKKKEAIKAMKAIINDVREDIQKGQQDIQKYQTEAQYNADMAQRDIDIANRYENEAHEILEVVPEKVLISHYGRKLS